MGSVYFGAAVINVSTGDEGKCVTLFEKCKIVNYKTSQGTDVTTTGLNVLLKPEIVLKHCHPGKKIVQMFGEIPFSQ